MNKIVLAGTILLLPFLTCAQSEKQKRASVDTRVMYDVRGQGIEAAYDFVIRNHQRHPVIIGVASDDAKFIEAVKQIIREMDWQGYENIVLLLNDKRKTANADGETHDVIFYKNDNIDCRIVKADGSWGIVFVGKQSKLSSVMLAKNESDYPLSLIRTKIRTTHNGSGADNFVSGVGD